MNRYKTLQEKAKAKGKLLLIESVSYIPKADDVVIFDSVKLVESVKGQKFEARGILKNVPVTRYTENANGRVYSEELWDNVHKSGLFEGSDCLADHADDDGSVLNTTGVWHNFNTQKETANADLYCIGAVGSLLLEKAKAGGKVGFSTVGFGTLSEQDNKTVDPGSYEYEQTDWVRKPSQNVYATQENLEESTKEVKEVIKESKITENIITNNILTKTAEVKKMDKIMEMAVKSQIRSAIKEAIANENYVAAIKELKEVSDTIVPEMVEQKAQVDAAIVSIQTKLSEQKEIAQKELKESKETLESLNEKYQVACKTINTLKENLQKAQTIVEKAVNKDTQKSIEKMKEDINQFSNDRVKMEEDIKLFIEEIEKRDADLKIYEEDTELREKDIAKFKEERENMSKKISKTSKALKIAEKTISKLEKILEDDYGYEFDNEEDDSIIDTGNDVIDDAFGFEDDEDFYEAENEDEDEEEKKESVKSKKKKPVKEAEEDEDKDDSEDEEEMEEAEDDEDEDELEEADNDDEDEEIEEEDDGEEDSDDDKMAAVRAAKKEAIARKKRIEAKKDKKSVKESKSPDKLIVEYYKAAVKTKPALKDIQKQILKSNSLLEAVKKVNLFETKFGNDIHKLKESVKENKDQKFQKYEFKI